MSCPVSVLGMESDFSVKTSTCPQRPSCLAAHTLLSDMVIFRRLTGVPFFHKDSVLLIMIHRAIAVGLSDLPPQLLALTRTLSQSHNLNYPVAGSEKKWVSLLETSHLVQLPVGDQKEIVPLQKENTPLPS